MHSRCHNKAAREVGSYLELHPTRHCFCTYLSSIQQQHRLQEADRALSQALGLGLADSSLLREIGNCYVAAGRLDAAEDALRMSLAADVSGGNGASAGGDGGSNGGRGKGSGVGNPHTRRCLADVLSAKNSTSQVCGV